MTFGELDRSTDGLARGLQRAGLAAGDRVLLIAENQPELVVSIFATLKAGGVFSIVSPAIKADRLAFLLEDSGARVVIADSRLASVAGPAAAVAPSVETTVWIGAAPGRPTGGEAFASLLRTGGTLADPGVIDEDLAAIAYTSGSTGRPKGVMLTHRNVHHSTWSISTYLGNVPDDQVVCVLPLSFGYGLFQVLAGVRVGYTVLLERSFAYPYDVLRRMESHRVTGLPAVPTILATILQMEPLPNLDLSSLRYITNAAAPWPPAHIRRIHELFPQAQLFSMYGLTECTRVSYLDPARIMEKITSVGKPIPNTQAFVVDEAGRRVSPGVTGELVVRGAGVMRGYWRRPEETAGRLRDWEIPGEKVLYTGDEFWADDQGFLYFVGRKDDVFKCRGQKVSPKEVEAVLFELDAVAEAAVIGVPDEIDGMAVKAVVVAADGADLTERTVRRHCSERLESHLVPKFIELRGALPKTDSGKIKRTALA